MKIALLGATGRTGRHILHAALLEGQQVSVLVRNPAKLTPDRDQVTIFLGDALDAEMVAYSMRECDVVGSALGLADNVEPDALSLATANIVNAMQQNGIQRLVVVAGAGILQDRQGERLRMEAPDFNPAYSPYAVEHRRVYDCLRQSQLDWTLVCPGVMHDESSSGALRVEVDHLPTPAAKVTYADVGHFVYQLLATPEYQRQRIGVAGQVGLAQ
ncbi:SDR family oxidoreductase [Caldilinea sp.]|uniref:NAD(P)-dependent oxidoreductase n=1 Tax=Caldilinea sp. TaxID=2293560 RepID=UPI002D136483|nr:SDR family oxidoreductase [Anaerolineales bacterium]HQY93995.1 SDR family oxidoreductase [Caldilinea sp.]HRA65437.1 SDR family oxidoreductase [Caldilinea sp.]